MSARRAATVLALLTVASCEQPVANPRILEKYEDTFLRDLRRALDQPHDSVERREAFERTRQSAQAIDRASGLETGLRASVDLVLAAEASPRTARASALERLVDDGSDLHTQRLAQGQLERDPKWLSASLTSDSLYSDFTAFLNGVAQTVSAALTGNPIGTLQPLILSIEGVVRGQPLDPRDRKRIVLERRLRLEGESTAGPAYSELKERVEQLADQTAREEIWLGVHALEAGDSAAALAHLAVAESLALRTEECADLRGRIEDAVRTRNERLATSLVVEPTRDQSSTEIEAILMRPYSGAPSIAGNTQRQAIALREGSMIPVTADSEIESERAKRRSAAWRFACTGRRDSADPLDRYVAARRAETRSWLDVLAPILWVPSTLVRGGYAIFGDPIDDRALIDAQVRFVRRNPGEEHRPEILVELAERYQRRGEPWKAICALREAGDAASARDLERAEKQLALEMLDESATRAVRLSRLEWLERVLPDTQWANQARTEREKLLAEPESKSIPLGVARAFLKSLAIDPRFTNDDERDGELDPPRIEVEDDRVFVRVKTGKERAFVALELSPEDRFRAAALADEWAWRFEAVRAETYASRHRGVPVELYAGLGANGLAFYPRLLPETYLGDDESFYR